MNTRIPGPCARTCARERARVGVCVGVCVGVSIEFESTLARACVCLSVSVCARRVYFVYYSIEPRFPLCSDYLYKDYKDKTCKAKIWKKVGCVQTKTLFWREDMLVYWRLDIEWAPDRFSSFADRYM